MNTQGSSPHVSPKLLDGCLKWASQRRIQRRTRSYRESPPGMVDIKAVHWVGTLPILGLDSSTMARVGRVGFYHHHHHRDSTLCLASQIMLGCSEVDQSLHFLCLLLHGSCGVQGCRSMVRCSVSRARNAAVDAANSQPIHAACRMRIRRAITKSR